MYCLVRFCFSVFLCNVGVCVCVCCFSLLGGYGLVHGNVSGTCDIVQKIA